jgi:hypothetical protein
VGYDLIVIGNGGLQTLDGVQALQKVHGGLWLANNANLTSTAALESLEQVGEQQAAAAAARQQPMI